MIWLVKGLAILCFLVVFTGCTWLVDKRPSIVMAIVCALIVAWTIIQLYSVVILQWQ
jgi:hypothetical protein